MRTSLGLQDFREGNQLLAIVLKGFLDALECKKRLLIALAFSVRIVSASQEPVSDVALAH